MSKRKRGIIIMFLGVLIIVVSIVAARDSVDTTSSASNNATSTATSMSATSTLDDLGITIEGIDGATIELVDAEAPEIDFDLHRPVHFTGAFVDNIDAQQAITKKINSLVATIEENGGSLENWLNLGIYWKQVDDFEGAALAWEYASKLRPLNDVSFTDLGNLYHLYLKNYPRSEKNFRMAIQNNSNNIPAYIELHSLYANSYTEKKNLAGAVLEEGLLANPGNDVLTSALAKYNVK